MDVRTIVVVAVMAVSAACSGGGGASSEGGADAAGGADAGSDALVQGDDVAVDRDGGEDAADGESDTAAPLPGFDELPEREALPELLTALDGASIETAEQWRSQRRPEILRLVQHYAYGAPPRESGEVEVELDASYDDLWGGRAVMRLYSVRFGEPREGRLELLVVLPSGGAPAPVFLGPNFFGNHATIDDPRVPLASGWVPERGDGVVENRATEASRGTTADRWPFEAVVERGYGLATFYHGDLDPDMNVAGDGVQRLYDDPEATWATLSAWAWGVSRAIDALEQEPGVDASRIAAVGHSRNGKVALLAGALDARVALVVANMSGCMGAALSRRREGETIFWITQLFPHWFVDGFERFADNEARLPFDQHFLIALAAPRPVLIASGVEDDWADPEGEFLGARAAAPVYTLLGVEGMDPGQPWPEVGELVGERLGYHVRPGGHSVDREGWEVFMDFADAHLNP